MNSNDFLQPIQLIKQIKFEYTSDLNENQEQIMCLDDANSPYVLLAKSGITTDQGGYFTG